MPVFEGLLPDEHNENLMDLLFTLAHWHALAKLRQHTDLSLGALELITIQLGASLRKFQAQTCSAFDTRELKREEIARMRRTEGVAGSKKLSAKNADDVVALDMEVVPSNTASSSTASSTNTYLVPTKAAGKLRKTLNLKTYKDHSLGDYVETIRRNGTTDSYSTETASPRPFHTYFYAHSYVVRWS